MAQSITTPAPLMNIELDPWQILTASLAGPGLVQTDFGVLGTQTTGSVRILPLFLGKFLFRKPFVALGALFVNDGGYVRMERDRLGQTGC